MELRELRYFLAVYETGGITTAARRCFISQPSISAAVAALEAELGTLLFVRHKRGVTPTAAAETLYPRARQLVDEAVALSGLFPAQNRRGLVLGLMKSLDVRRTGALLAALTLDPALHLTLVDASDACDARLVGRTLVKDDEAFTPFWTERYLVALPPTHPLRFQQSVAVSDLADQRFVSRCHCENNDLFAQLGFRPEIAAVAHSEEWAVALVRAGIGVAVIPEGVAPESVDLVTRPLTGLRAEREVGLAHPAGAPISAEIQALVSAASTA